MKNFRRIFSAISCIAMLIIIAFVGYNILIDYTYKPKFLQEVTQYSQEFSVEKELVLAVIKCESSFNEKAESTVGAAGLMQLTEETFLDVKKMLQEGDDITFATHAKVSEINIKYGTRYLKYLSELYVDDEIAVIAAYNAGMGNVNKWLGSDGKLDFSEIKFSETKAYVKKVLKAKEYYKEKY